MTIPPHGEHIKSAHSFQAGAKKTQSRSASRCDRAKLLTRARVKQHVLEIQRQARTASRVVAGGLSLFFLFASSSEPSLPGMGDMAAHEPLEGRGPVSAHGAALALSPGKDTAKLGEPQSHTSQTASIEGREPLFEIGPVRVNRAAKGDLFLSRAPAFAAGAEPKAPYLGTLFKMDDLFSPVDEKALPRTSLIAPGGREEGQAAPLAVARFHKSGQFQGRAFAKAVKPEADAEETASDTGQVALAYAPVQNMEELKTPFAAVLNAPDKVGRQGPESRQSASAGEVSSLAPTGEVPLPISRINRPPLAAGDHSWAANPLAKSVFSRREQRCLAAGVYFEARGEPVNGQAAVAQVILNRVKNPAYPSTVCGVVYQNKRWRNRCQFSFVCDGIRDRVRDKRSYQQAVRIARDVTRGNIWLKSVGSSTHYHATFVRPRWAGKMQRMVRIGNHIFYRTYGGGWS